MLIIMRIEFDNSLHSLINFIALIAFYKCQCFFLYFLLLAHGLRKTKEEKQIWSNAVYSHCFHSNIMCMLCGGQRNAFLQYWTCHYSWKSSLTSRMQFLFYLIAFVAFCMPRCSINPNWLVNTAFNTNSNEKGIHFKME